MATLNIDDDTARAIVSGAILAGIGDDARDTLIAQAIDYLIAPQVYKNGYREETGPSRVENAFRAALDGVVHQVVRELLDTPETRERVAATVQPVIDQLTAADPYSTELQSKVTAVIFEHLRSTR